MNVMKMILLCALVTMVPRILPFFMPFLSKLPRFVKKCMMLLPVAALGALIFPLALTDFGTNWFAGLLGVATAFFVSYNKGSMFVSILASLAITVATLLVIAWV